MIRPGKPLPLPPVRRDGRRPTGFLVCSGPLRFVPLPPTDEADERRRELIDCAVRESIKHLLRRQALCTRTPPDRCKTCVAEIMHRARIIWPRIVSEFA